MKMRATKGVEIKMNDLIQFFIEEMDKRVIELTCASMVNILKYVLGVKGVDDAGKPWSLKFIPDESKTQKMCEKSVVFSQYSLEFVSLKKKRCVNGLLRMKQKP